MSVSDGASVHGVSAAGAQQWPAPHALLPVAYTPHPVYYTLVFKKILT